MLDFKRDTGAWGFVLFWGALVGAFDYFMVQGFVEAVRSASFESTPGVVAKCQVQRGHRGSVNLDLEYAYAIQGQPLTGTHYHVQPRFVGNRYWYAIRDALPVGAPVTVYYDPAHPNDSYLAPGFRSDMLFIVWWMVPFNLILIGAVWGGIWSAVNRRMFDPMRRWSVWPTRDGWAARPRRDTAFLPNAFLALIVITFLGCFPTMGYILVFGFPPPWWLPILAGVLALAGAVGYGLRTSRRAILRVNEREGALTLPVTGGKQPTPAREQVRRVEITSEPRKKNGNEYAHFNVALRWRDDFEQELVTPLATYDDGADANALATWLRERLGLTDSLERNNPLEPVDHGH